jgi:hypothetical protein
MPAKAKKRSARKPKPQCQCQQQIKDILRRLEPLEADKVKIVCEMKPINSAQLLDTYQQFAAFIAESVRFKAVQSPPPNPERERFIAEFLGKWVAQDIAREIDRQLPRKRRKQGARIIDVDRDHHPRSRSSRHSQGGHKQE